MVASDAALLRLVWHPSHFEDGKLKGSAFDKADLIPLMDKRSQQLRYMSVDLEESVSKDAVNYVIANQQADGKDQKLGRHEANFVRFISGELESYIDTKGRSVFSVEPAPIPASVTNPRNAAHCAVRRKFVAEKSEQEVFVQEVRTALLELNRGILSYNDVFPA